MGYGIATSLAASELTLLNKILLLVGLRPTSSTTLLPDTDPYFAHMLFNDVLREESAKGWYLFNKFDCVECLVVADPSTPTVYSPLPIYKADVSTKTLENYCDFPKTLHKVASDLLVARLPQEQTVLNTLGGTTVWLDIITLINPLGSGLVAPDVFLNYCAIKAADRFAPSVGAVIQARDIVEAKDALMREEDIATPRSNVFFDNPTTAATWMNR